MSKAIPVCREDKEPTNVMDGIGTDIIDHIGVFYYHKKLLKFLENSKFSCDTATFELFCQMNPGYKFFSVLNTTDQSTVVKLHEKYLEDFWKFNMYSRAFEVIQTYTDRLFAVPKRFIGSATVELQSVKLKRALMVPRELHTKINDFIRAVDTGRDAIREQSGFKRGEVYHAEVFDNLVRDLQSFCNMCVDTDIMRQRKADFIPITDYMYMRIVRWLSEKCDNVNSNLLRDSDQFNQMLHTFVYIHHIHYLCGDQRFIGATWDVRDPEALNEDYQESRQPYRSFANSKKGGRVSRTNYFHGSNLMERRGYMELEDKMAYYGHLTPGNCLCTRSGIYPTMSRERTPNTDIVEFLALQEYFYGQYRSGEYY